MATFLHKDVVAPVAVEVAHSGYDPVQVGHRADETLAWLDRLAIHEVDVVLSRARVAPQDVGLAVAVEVADARDFPALIGHRAQIALASPDRGAVHRIEIVLPRSVVTPQDVRTAVAIEVEARHRGHARARTVYRVDRAASETCDVQLARLVLAEGADAAGPID